MPLMLLLFVGGTMFRFGGPQTVLRTNGATEPEKVAAVVLETDGSFSVLSDMPSSAAGHSVLREVPRASDRA